VRNASCDNHQLRVLHYPGVAASGEAAVELEEGGGLANVQGYPLRHVLADIEKCDLATKLFLG
jgi:hypothetical protein